MNLAYIKTIPFFQLFGGVELFQSKSCGKDRFCIQSLVTPSTAVELILTTKVARLHSLLVPAFHLLCISKEMLNFCLSLLDTFSAHQLFCLPCRMCSLQFLGLNMQLRLKQNKLQENLQLGWNCNTGDRLKIEHLPSESEMGFSSFNVESGKPSVTHY